MSISMLYLFALLATFVPGATYSLFQRVYTMEQAEIAMDNAGIRMGRARRASFNALVDCRVELDNRHSVYHRLLMCAQVPATAAHCTAALPAAVSAIRLYEAACRVKSMTLWNNAEVEFNHENERVRGILQTTPNRDWFGAITTQPCSVCALPRGWAYLGTTDYRQDIYSNVPDAQPIQVIWRGARNFSYRWNYRLAYR